MSTYDIKKYEAIANAAPKSQADVVLTPVDTTPNARPNPATTKQKPVSNVTTTKKSTSNLTEQKPIVNVIPDKKSIVTPQEKKVGVKVSPKDVLGSVDATKSVSSDATKAKEPSPRDVKSQNVNPITKKPWVSGVERDIYYIEEKERKAIQKLMNLDAQIEKLKIERDALANMSRVYKLQKLMAQGAIDVSKCTIVGVDGKTINLNSNDADHGKSISAGNKSGDESDDKSEEVNVVGVSVTSITKTVEIVVEEDNIASDEGEVYEGDDADEGSRDDVSESQ